MQAEVRRPELTQSANGGVRDLHPALATKSGRDRIKVLRERGRRLSSMDGAFPLTPRPPPIAIAGRTSSVPATNRR